MQNLNHRRNAGTSCEERRLRVDVGKRCRTPTPTRILASRMRNSIQSETMLDTAAKPTSQARKTAIHAMDNARSDSRPAPDPALSSGFCSIEVALHSWERQYPSHESPGLGTG